MFKLAPHTITFIKDHGLKINIGLTAINLTIISFNVLIIHMKGFCQ